MLILFNWYKLGIISENTILKAIHNQELQPMLHLQLGIISENTILKAIHNRLLFMAKAIIVGNYKRKYNFESNSQLAKSLDERTFSWEL